ncbi:MAG: exopolyphosphatase-like protein [Clostridiales bacterium]|jgi:nanoRNase/pAp phosphatase (c-di-AMP/oligoRNAs hydrolase)|nr:exopolyphosphatase-like protein [Clostridiales bacterium]
MSDLIELIGLLSDEDNIYIQCHNFPDHDAIASAFGLQVILKQFNIDAHIIYKGEIQRESLKKMIEILGIEANNYLKYNITQNDKVIIVDGCMGNSNVGELEGEEIAVIDHHLVNEPENVKYVDIRPDYGACSTIIYTYFKTLNIDIPQRAATALMIGLSMDTALLTRHVSQFDVESYPHLYVNANVSVVNSILRNYIQTKDLKFYKFLLDNIIIKDRFAFCYFNDGCNQNLLGILGDFLLSLEEIEFSVLCAKNKDVINFSIRNESRRLNASTVLQTVLEGIGFGGGHNDMAGGVIKDISRFDKDKIYERFICVTSV